MDQIMDVILSRDISTSKGTYTLEVSKEDLFSIYPGMIRFTVSVRSGDREHAVFRTNTYEYSPTVPLKAGQVAMDTADAWEHEIREDPEEFLAAHRMPAGKEEGASVSDAVVIQGSPRADGNCSILAGLAVDALVSSHHTAQVIYPHDMNIHSCIGCYQCYNTGTCTFDDDMTGILRAIRHAPLIIVCTPVYTNSVPGGLKLLIDRCQAYHAEQTLFLQSAKTKRGLLLSVAGRRGKSNFSCITSVIGAFMRNLGIEPAGELLIDGVDEMRDIRNIPDLKERIRSMVRNALTGPR